MDRSELALVIPAFNEAATISRVVEGARRYGRPIVVDDASTDKTAALAAAAGADVVRHERNHGYDGALESGFRRAAELGCEHVITLDADGQHDPALIGAFAERLAAGADLVAGVRDRRQRFSEHLFAWAGRFLWGLRDPLCGMKGYRLEHYRALGHFDSHGSIGTELAIFVVRQRGRVEELAVPTRPRGGSSRFGSTFRTNFRILAALLRSVFMRNPESGRLPSEHFVVVRDFGSSAAKEVAKILESFLAQYGPRGGKAISFVDWFPDEFGDRPNCHRWRDLFTYEDHNRLWSRGYATTDSLLASLTGEIHDILEENYHTCAVFGFQLVALSVFRSDGSVPHIYLISDALRGEFGDQSEPSGPSFLQDSQ